MEQSSKEAEAGSAREQLPSMPCVKLYTVPGNLLAQVRIGDSCMNQGIMSE